MWAHVVNAARRAAGDMLSRVLQAAVESADMPGPATSTSPMSNPRGAPRSASEVRAMIDRRALMKGNRNRAAAEVYRARHLSLVSLICSGAEE